MASLELRAGGGGHVYYLATVVSLPALPPPPQPREHPLKSLLQDFVFCLPARWWAGLRCWVVIDDGERGAGTVSGAG